MRARLDPDNIDVIIQCHACHGNLWRMKILKRSGDVVMSAEYKPMAEGIPPHSDKILKCPLCDRDYVTYRRNQKGEPVMIHRIRDVATGQVHVF